ncbi:HNH endonuclease [Streptomyces sp. H27-H1]|uniref:HNH endonuclease n=1 Tax=Streptomyces sp. H27-H1 TaxID=2996461 RepID=UPI00226E0B2C|nr:HNH endonuclease [Streptomyces sp. H27-H1]MCY0926228.1 HNH endonuclease [Streptomyces sp. H27-H1]
MDEITEKKCTKCGAAKALDAFYAKAGGKGGRAASCKVCNREVARGNSRRRREENPERSRESARQWREANPERDRENKRRWREENPERHREHKRRWREENPERAREGTRQWREANPERSRESARESTRRWREANSERSQEIVRQWREENPERLREYSRRRRALEASAAIEPFTARDLRADWEALDLYDCFYCGGPPQPLHVDHFYPLKPADADEAPGPHALFNLVPSCETCNLSKNNRDPWQFLRDAMEERGVDLDACMKFISGR